jgi:hypothetical protein
MDREQFEQMSTNELWALHSLVDSILAARLKVKKEELERRLQRLPQLKDPTGE